MGMVEELEDSGLGVKEEEVWRGALLYADDIVLLAESPDELQRMLDTVGEYAEEWRFTFNAVKSKTMVVGTSSGGSSWRINGQEMEEVKVFKYLGLCLTEVCEVMCKWRKWQRRQRNGQGRWNGRVGRMGKLKWREAGLCGNSLQGQA